MVVLHRAHADFERASLRVRAGLLQTAHRPRSLRHRPATSSGQPALPCTHFAITDESRHAFRYEHRKSTGGAFDLPAAASEERYYLRLGNWTVREAEGAHILRATLNDDLIFEATLKNTKPHVLNGHEGVGVSFKDEGEASRYFSLTRMEAEGLITWHGETEHFKGSAWMDREFGTWRTTENQKGWDWFRPEER